MLQDLMNMEGVAVLSKQQQSAIQGGGYCKYTVFTDGESEVWYGFGLNESIADQTVAAHNGCADFLNGGADRCFYDCSADD
jgi:hypothetical protein